MLLIPTTCRMESFDWVDLCSNSDCQSYCRSLTFAPDRWLFHHNLLSLKGPWNQCWCNLDIAVTCFGHFLLVSTGSDEICGQQRSSRTCSTAREREAEWVVRVMIPWRYTREITEADEDANDVSSVESLKTDHEDDHCHHHATQKE